MTNESIESKLASLNRIFFDQQSALSFLEFLKTKAPVFAPHKKGDFSFSYQQVDDINKVVFKYPRTIQSIKKYFLPPKETLLTFNIDSNTYRKVKLKSQKRIFFAVHSYEMQAVKCLDYSFCNGNNESNYLTRRDKAIFIGIDYVPDEMHFSKSVGIDIEQLDGFSLFFCSVDDGYMVFAVDTEGNKLLKEFGLDRSLQKGPVKIKEKEFKSKIRYHYNRIPQVFTHMHKSRVWDKYAQRCLGCATCNLICPTCFCFDVQDEVELDAKNGYRQRVWDGCMLNSFAQVAGGENFRESLAERTRHRLYRKFKYITEKSGLIHCVGCGRCSSYCPAGITMPDIVNDLIDDYEEKQKLQVI